MERLIGGARKLGINLSPRQITQFQTYFEELTDWNQRFNLTAIVDYQEVQIKHFLDSLTIGLAFDTNVSSLRLLDVGSGAGLPGLPLKIVWPQIDLTLLESVSKKTKFLQHIVAKLGLDKVEVINGRAEEIGHWPRYREQFDVVVSRGVAALATLSELCLPFCRIAAIFIAQKKGDLQQELAQASKALSLLGGELKEIKQVQLPELADQRCLIITEKIAATPSLYPRRPGVPGKRPLGQNSIKEESSND